jgi:glycosyltransferase involved in cell wall biosynthesis
MLLALGQLGWWVGVRRVGIVHLHVAAFNSFWRKSIFLLVAKSLRAKVVLHWHSPRLKQFIDANGVGARSYIERIFMAADVVLAASGASVSELTEVFRQLRPRVIYNPVDDKIRVVPPNAIERNVDILFMAALLPEKGIFDLVDAFVIVREVCPSARLIMCGTGLDQELRERVASKGLAGAVQLPGWISGDDRNTFFGQAAVFCLPSRADTFAMANLDAMAAGLPVVSTFHGGIPEVVQDGVNGLLVPTGDIGELAKKLIVLLKNPPLRVSLGQAGARIARERFSTERMIAELLALYKELGRN